MLSKNKQGMEVLDRQAMKRITGGFAARLHGFTGSTCEQPGQSGGDLGDLYFRSYRCKTASYALDSYNAHNLGKYPSK